MEIDDIEMARAFELSFDVDDMNYIFQCAEFKVIVAAAASWDNDLESIVDCATQCIKKRDTQN